MKICGTVWRPLRRTISARRSGCSSRLISAKFTPLPRSRVRANSQYGHQELEYISILGAAMIGWEGAARHRAGYLVARDRKLFGPPRAQAAAQVDHLAKTQLRQLTHGRRGAGAALAINNDGFVLVA